MTRLDRLLAPTSIAVVGATDRAGSYAANTLANLERAGFPGRIIGVHPTRSSVLGVPCVPTLDDVGTVDAVVIATPAESVAEYVARAADADCGGCIVYAAGFAEIGRMDLQRALIDAAGDMPVIGPNGNGVVAVASRAPMWGDAVTLPRAAGGIGLVTDSGNVGVIALGHRGAQGLHTVVSTGNSATVGAAAVVGHLAATSGIEAIAVYAESDGDGQAWCQALAACAERDVRVVVLKAGRSARGAAVGQAHTAAIVGDHRVFAAMIAEAGGVMVEEPWQLLETARALTGLRRDPRGAAIVTCSGADAAIAADVAADVGVQLADLSTSTLADLTEVLPAGATAANPLDHTAMLWADVEGLARVTEIVGRDPAVGHLLYVQDEPPGLPDGSRREWRATREGALAGAERSTQQPLLVASTPGQEPDGAVAGLVNALRAVQAMQAPPPDVDRLHAMSSACRQVHGPAARGALDERQAKLLAAAHGIEVPEGEVVDRAEDAPAAAARLGGPVVLKALDARLAHKSEVGGVVLDARTDEQIADATRRLLGIAPRVLVERRVPAGTEVLVAARRDGVVPTLTIGLGGVWTEALDDVAVIPLPATSTRIHEAVTGLRGAGVLTGARGQNRLDVGALCLLAERVGSLLIAEGLAVVEVNPVIVGSDGATAVDVLMR